MRTMLVLCAMIAAVGRNGFAQMGGSLAESIQLLVVTTPDWNSVQGRLERWERIPGTKSWRVVGDAIPIVVGKNGMAWGSGMILPDGVQQSGDPIKREGDGRSPAGVFSLGTAFGYAPKAAPGTMLPSLNL